MLSKYDPLTNASLVDLQARICKVPRAQNISEVVNMIGAWEAEYRVYMKKVGQELGDLTRQNLLLALMPHQGEKSLRFRMHTQKEIMTYESSNQDMFDVAVNMGGMDSRHASAGPMDVDNLDLDMVLEEFFGGDDGVNIDELKEDLLALKRDGGCCPRTFSRPWRWSRWRPWR